MKQDWHKEIKIVLEARKNVLNALKISGWKIVHLGDGEAYYTTNNKRTSTLCLHSYVVDSIQLWRWHIDHHSVCQRGRCNEIYPHPPDGQVGIELTCTEEELPAFAEWLPKWLIASDNRSLLPIPPVPIDSSDWKKGYVWTLKAKELCNNLIKEK